MFECSCTSLTLTATICWSIYLLLTWSFGYWKKKGIKEARSYPLFGSFPSAFTHKQHIADDVEEIYRKYRGTENFVGVFTAMKPQLLILDPELAHNIYVNDFESFHDNEVSNFVDEKTDIMFANSALTIKGQKWKKRRAEITPGLSMNRIKSVYPVTLQVCARFKLHIDELIKAPSDHGIDIMDLALRFTCGVSTDCVLGVKANTMEGTPSHVLEMTKGLFDGNFRRTMDQLIVGFLPGLEKFYKIRFFSKVAEIYFTDLMKRSIEMRKQGSNDEVDFLTYWLQLQEKKRLSTEEMTVHAMTFLVDGFITTAVTIAHCLLLLARFPNTQEKLRKEILETLNVDGAMDFEKLHELPYLDACFHESLRIFAPILIARKLCTSTFVMENKDGTKLLLHPNDVVVVPVNSIHLDEKYWEKPSEYIPERFLGEKPVKSYRDRGLFYGFGDGPRVCLGMRFALTQGKAAIVEVIKNYQIAVNPKTRSDNCLDPKQFIGMLDGGIHLNFESLQ